MATYFRYIGVSRTLQITFQTCLVNEEKSYKSKYLFLRFSKCNETSPKLVYFKETSGTVMHGKIQLLPMKNAKVPNQDS